MARAVRLSLRRLSADGPLIGRIPDKGPGNLTLETLEVLSEYQNLLEALIRVDFARRWGYAAAFNGRLGQRKQG